MALKFPADFDKCVRKGGRVRTISVKDHPDQYMHVCYLNGKSYAGEAKTKKEASEVSAYLQNQGYVENKGEFIKASETTLKVLSPQIELTKKIFSSRKPSSEIEILHAGEWEHPQYGIIRITDDDIDKFIASFNDKVRKVDIAVDQEHMPEKGAAGWFKSLKKVVENGKTKLKASVEWTKLGTQLITDGIFKYFSPEFDFQYEDLETHEMFDNVLLGGALTNRPYFKSLAPVALSENMYAGFTSKFKEKGGEDTMTKEELKAKLVEDPEFALADDASEEEKKAFEEAKAEIAKEAENEDDAGDEDEDEEGGDEEEDEEDESVKGSEKFISKADHVKEMNELKSRLGVAEKKLRFKEVQEQVDSFVFSESNPDGVILPKNKEAAVKVLMASNEKVAKLFSEFLASLPKVSAKLFKEEGGDEGQANDNQSKIDAEVEKVMKANSMRYSEALKVVTREKPELFK
jgi:phage I-like protein